MLDIKKIKSLRNEKGMTQRDLAEKVFVSQAMIQGIEVGIKKPGADLLKLLADALNVTTDDLYIKATK